jgi:hypothetical protein
MSGHNICKECAVKFLGIQDASSREQTLDT